MTEAEAKAYVDRYYRALVSLGNTLNHMPMHISELRVYFSAFCGEFVATDADARLIQSEYNQRQPRQPGDTMTYNDLQRSDL